jgi:hypothetical protein
MPILVFHVGGLAKYEFGPRRGLVTPLNNVTTVSGVPHSKQIHAGTLPLGIQAALHFALYTPPSGFKQLLAA